MDTGHCLQPLERVNRDVSRESRTARLRSLLLRLLLPPRFSSSTFLSCASPCYIDIRPRTRSPHNAAFAVEESDVLRRACRPRACARAYAFGSLVRLLSFLLTCALTGPSRCISVHTSGRRVRRWRRLILPRAELFRKAKDDKGRSESAGRESANGRSKIVRLFLANARRNDYV